MFCPPSCLSMEGSPGMTSAKDPPRTSRVLFIVADETTPPVVSACPPVDAAWILDSVGNAEVPPLLKLRIPEVRITTYSSRRYDGSIVAVRDTVEDIELHEGMDWEAKILVLYMPARVPASESGVVQTLREMGYTVHLSPSGWLAAETRLH